MSKLTALIEVAKAATPGPWIAGRLEATGTSDNREPYSPWIIGAGPRPVTVGRGTCIHADDMAFIALANPATILELCALLEKAELGLQICLGAIMETSPCMSEECKQEQTEVQVVAERFGNETLAAIKQWKEQT